MIAIALPTAVRGPLLSPGLALFAFVRAAAPSTSFTQEPKARDVTHFDLGKHALALDGYDPVAYFEFGGGNALAGSEKIATTHAGVVFRFASQEHSQLFLKERAKFEPQYGGWCAYAMADGRQVEIDPESFVVHDGKLHLFYESFFNTRAKWRKDPAKRVQRGDAKWADTIAPPKPKRAPAP